MNHRFVFAIVMGLGTVGCEHVGNGYDVVTPGVTPTSSAAGASATPSSEPSASTTGSCNTTQDATVFIGMSTAFTEYDDPNYGEVAGYTNVTANTPTQAAVIQATTSDVIQFVNFDTTTDHSAVGFPANSTSQSGFPPQPYTFPTAAATAEASTISSLLWSTGRIPGSASTTCLSQAFHVPTPGTYYFGDLDFYNTITSLRDVLVVTENSASSQQHTKTNSLNNHPRRELAVSDHQVYISKMAQ